jgi:hypothetical protein
MEDTFARSVETEGNIGVHSNIKKNIKIESLISNSIYISPKKGTTIKSNIHDLHMNSNYPEVEYQTKEETALKNANVKLKDTNLD